MKSKWFFKVKAVYRHFFFPVKILRLTHTTTIGRKSLILLAACSHQHIQLLPLVEKKFHIFFFVGKVYLVLEGYRCYVLCYTNIANHRSVPSSTVPFSGYSFLFFCSLIHHIYPVTTTHSIRVENSNGCAIPAIKQTPTHIYDVNTRTF